MTIHLPPSVAFACVAVLGLLAGCATTHVDAEWRDTQQPARSFKGQTVLVVCEAYDTVIRRLCQDQLMAESSARGVKPVLAPEAPFGNPWRPAAPDHWLAAARSAGASAVLTAVVEPGLQTVKPGFSIGVGLGGYGGGGGFGGVGVSAPVGGQQAMSGYLANSQFTEAAGGKLLWTARVTTDASTDVNGQMKDMAKSITEAAQKAGLF